jgi:UDP-N-acetyl-2-amino-2-deoxyglucuronate dehydrogenase
LIWFFGKVQKVTIHLADPERVAGFLELERATVSWFLSIRHADLPREASEKGKSTFRSLQIDGSEVEFTDGFEQLHTVVYKEMLAGRGFGIADVRPSIELVHSIRTEKISPGADVVHPFVGKAHD